KSSRLTFVECSRDINKMIDCAKIADTVIFLLDVNTGLESEHLEMKQILNCHGNPPIVAAISHVDVLAQSRSQQNKIMTSLKSRIKSQIDDGTSIVILKNGVLHEGKEYHLNSISVLSQKLSNLKTISRPWRDSSSFVLVDKFEFEPRIDQDSNYADLNLFGFIRGSLMKPGQSVLIPGVGGPFQIDKVTKLNDPCPLKSQHLKKRSLLSTEHLVYCPRALMEQNRAFGNNIKPAAILDDEKAQNSNNELIGGLSKPINIFSGDDRASAKLADGLKQHINSFDVSSTKKIANLKSLDFVDSESFTAPSLGENSKQSLARDSLNSIIVANDKEYMAKIIDKNANLKSALKPESMDMNDSVLSNFQQNYQRILESSKSGREDTVCGFMSKINSLFLTHEVLKQSKVNYKANTSSDDESYDEEIVEVEETLGLLSEEETIADEQTTPQNDQECKTECDSEANEKKCIDKGGKGKFSSGKSDHILDLISNADRQEKIDREFLADNSDSEFGHQTGTYVKIFIKDLPKAIETQLEDSSLLILGSMAPKQVTNSKLKCLIDMHCLQNRPLKSNVASLISFGWFRMQSAGVFCSQAPNLKLRFLKYSPRMVSSYFVFSGPVHEQKTGVVIFSNQNYNFRILATGSIVGSDSSICVQKKLKLIGTPCEIYKKTAMISGMFNSDLEAAKFEGAKLQTVSGIRGVVKKRTKSSMPGTIRAAFEDKISQNDN
ncbi:MAG: Glycoside hydrolase 2 (Mannanase, beta-galactosidase), partial [Marteilia pararefringens]